MRDKNTKSVFIVAHGYLSNPYQNFIVLQKSISFALIITIYAENDSPIRKRLCVLVRYIQCSQVHKDENFSHQFLGWAISVIISEKNPARK